MFWVELVPRDDCLPLDVQKDVDEGELVTVAIEAREERGEFRCGLSSIRIALDFMCVKIHERSKGRKQSHACGLYQWHSFRALRIVEVVEAIFEPHMGR